jgi:hypothetical protein
MTKVWYVYASYDSGGHEKGFWRSPLFSSEELAEQFLEYVDSIPLWHTDSWTGRVMASIRSEIVTDLLPDKLQECEDYAKQHKQLGYKLEREIEKQYLTIVYT